MTVFKGNLNERIPLKSKEEIFETLSLKDSVRIERIISTGHASPDDFWYDQDQDEFVLLYKGKAAIKFEDDDEVVIMDPGGWLVIPAHKKHRVEWTDPSTPTIWLTVFY